MGIDALVREGELYSLLPGAVQCYACAHRCKIKPGARGICQVRYNLNGKLYVPHGYVSALNADPIEKKPFFHVLPGSDVLTFGMLGCDLHCEYCFTPETVVMTDRGPRTIAAVFNEAGLCEHRSNANTAFPHELRTVSGTGKWRHIEAVFKHHYKGSTVVLKPYYLPPIRCTSNHRVYATDDIATAPQPTPAHLLSKKHYLAIPRRFNVSMPQPPQFIDVAQLLCDVEVTHAIPWDLTPAQRQAILDATAQGISSREIGAQLGKSGSYIRHVRSKLRRGAGDTRIHTVTVTAGELRFPNEHRPGIPAMLPLDESFAKLLGYYCAEGSSMRSKKRPNSHAVSFSFSNRETGYVEEVSTLLQQMLGVTPHVVQRDSTLSVCITKASAGLMFHALCGGRANTKRVPEALFHAPHSVMAAYLDAVVNGDGHRYANGKVSVTTVSTELAYGIAWLALQLGYLPSIYDAKPTSAGTILGRVVKRSPHQYTIVWYETIDFPRRVVMTDDYYLIPLRSIQTQDYDGDVYNMQVELEHNYLAGLLLVSNCQNWEISQTMRDADAGRPPMRIDAAHMVQLAQRYGARGIASSYNEPLITSEWAVDVFKQAKAAGLLCMYVSNGNATREVLEYIRPYTDAYKIDLKSMRDANYRALGTRLQCVLDSIRNVHELGFWLELVTLVIPGFNDSDDELRDAARFIRSVSPAIPWHVTAFHSDYKMADTAHTSAAMLLRAATIGYTEGLHYVYAGTLPGRSAAYENTNCPQCHAMLIERVGFRVMSNRLTPDGDCPRCGTSIPGRWR
jgi:pyruvate formate lyase activating enzyme